MNLDSGSKLVAEIPYPGVGLPQRRATVSEVATIAYLQPHTIVPIPRDSDSISRAPIHRGPWRDLQGFADSLVDVGIARVPTELPTIASGPPYQGLPQEHRDMLTTARSILQAISTSPSVQKASKPLLYHPDLHAGNIFVSEHDPTVVTDIID
ncbi:hypothetical protein SMMN14_07925 [Sphaerulina musiva]